MTKVLDVYSRDRGTFYGTLAAPHDGFDWSTALDGAGGGRVTVDADHPDAAILVEGRLVVVRDPDVSPDAVADGGSPDAEVAAWIIEAFGEEVGDAWVADSITGPEVYSILEESCIEPAGGIGTRTTDKRWFGPMSPEYDDASWDPAYSHGTMHEPRASQMPSPHRAEWPTAHYNPAGKPEDFPDPDAEKLWDDTVDADGESPTGWVHFRREFYVDVDVEYDLSVASDNLSSTFVDGIPTHSIDNLPGFDRTYRETVQLDAGWHVLYGRTYNWQAGPAWYAFSGYDEDAPPGDKIRRSHTWVGHPTPVVVLGYPASPPGMTPGAILEVLLTEAQARGELAGVTWAFTGAVDSAGVPWPLELEIAFSIGQSYAKICAALLELGCEVEVTPDLEVRAYVRRGQDRSGTVNLTVPGAQLGTPKLSRRHRPRTRFVVRLEGEYAEIVDAAGVALYGVRTEFLSLGGIPQGTAAAAYLSDVIENRSGPQLDTSLELDPTIDLGGGRSGPYRAAGGAFDLGDDVTAPAHRLPGGTPMRTLAIGGAVDAGGVETADVDLGA